MAIGGPKLPHRAAPLLALWAEARQTDRYDTFSLRFEMRPNRWTGLDWWHRTAIVAFAVTGIALAGAFVLAGWLDDTMQAGRMGRISWISLSIFPLFMVLAVAFLAAAQRMVNTRMGQTHRTKAVFTSTARREEDEAANTGQVEIILDEYGQPVATLEKEALAP